VTGAGHELPELPSDPALAAVARAIEAHGFAGEIWDAGWRLAYLSNEYRVLIAAGQTPDQPDGLGEHFLSSEQASIRENWRAGPLFDSLRASLRGWGGYIVGATPGGREALRAIADPRFADLLDELTPETPPAAWSTRIDIRYGTESIGNDVLTVRVHGEDGAVAGYASVIKPSMRATVLGMLALGDARLFEQMSGLIVPARRPAAVLFADLENSTSLSRRLSTPSYFALIRRLTSRSDRAVVSAGGIVGKHVGDGVTAFFLASEAGSESSAVRACIESMRGIRAAALEAAERSGLAAGDVTIRFGLHWGATLYVGRLITSGRAEVTALGDEVNEAARIEACATGGRALASKALVERLEVDDAGALGIDAGDASYTALADLPSATDKARRDAPAIAVCEL
jgi:class 3 adenylate cyclase